VKLLECMFVLFLLFGHQLTITSLGHLSGLRYQFKLLALLHCLGENLAFSQSLVARLKDLHS